MRLSSGDSVGTWTHINQFLKQHGTVFLVVKFGSFTPLMYLCYHIPSAFGYDSISDYVRSQGKYKILFLKIYF